MSLAVLLAALAFNLGKHRNPLKSYLSTHNAVQPAKKKKKKKKKGHSPTIHRPPTQTT
ncbi:hypothetical protein HZ326_14521, partial [Fusarium oxysporum f. sp. albedinis]